MGYSTMEQGIRAHIVSSARDSLHACTLFTFLSVFVRCGMFRAVGFCADGIDMSY